MSRTLLHQEHRRERAKNKAKQGRMERNTRMKGGNKQQMSIPWLASVSVMLRNLWMFKFMQKPGDVAK
jgi:hypothetical protein